MNPTRREVLASGAALALLPWWPAARSAARRQQREWEHLPASDPFWGSPTDYVQLELEQQHTAFGRLRFAAWWGARGHTVASFECLGVKDLVFLERLEPFELMLRRLWKHRERIGGTCDQTFVHVDGRQRMLLGCEQPQSQLSFALTIALSTAWVEPEFAKRGLQVRIAE